MKKIIYLITFFVLGQWLYAQASSDSSYYPLDIGNKWLYYQQSDKENKYLIDGIIVTGDTIINGKDYSILEHTNYGQSKYIFYERIDSTNKSYRYNPVLESDLLLEDFNAEPNIAFISYRKENSGGIAYVYDRGTLYSSVMNDYYEYISIVYQRDHLENCEYLFCKGIGIIVFQEPPAMWMPLRGGVIRNQKYGIINSVEKLDGINLPQSLELKQNYPNPFNPSTKVKYKIDKEEIVTARVFDILGREVIYLFSEKKKAGEYSLDLNMKNFNSGIYFLQLNTISCVKSIKMLLVK